MKVNVREKISKTINMILRNSEMSIDTDFLFEINDEGLLTVKGCNDIKLYTESEIMLNCNTKCIYVKGDDLYIACFDRNCTEIKGKIITVEFIN